MQSKKVSRSVLSAAPFYDTADLIITLISLGKYLEARAKGQASESIKKLIDLQPCTAYVLRHDSEVEGPVEQVRVGEELLMRPGERIPVDGVVLFSTFYREWRFDRRLLRCLFLPRAWAGQQLLPHSSQLFLNIVF